jgi:hypothetical protein
MTNTESITPMMARAIEIGGKLWTGRAGVTRVYINHWTEIGGMEVNYYKTGSIAGASINGKGISNRAAAELLAAKVYVDETGLHMPTISGTGRYVMDELTAAVEAALAEPEPQPEPETITVYDAATQVDVMVEVAQAHDPECVWDSTTDDGRHYPAEDRYIRRYAVVMPDGTPWTATASWVGESNESQAHIALDEG